MRAFHASWFSFFIAFTSWFGIQPLLPTIIRELQLSKTDVANSGIASVAATIIVRMFVGPLCDKFGPRRIMSSLLLAGSIPMLLAGLVRNGTELIILRFFIGVLGASFVPCQFWTSMMFNSKIVGTTNALVGGWGNLGGGFTFLLMPGLFHMFRYIGLDDFMAWKIAVLVPALICCTVGISILFTTDDCPQGEWKKRKTLNEAELVVKGDGQHILEAEALTDTHEKQIEETEKQSQIWTVVTAGVLIIQYGMCFGVEIAMNTFLNLYLLYKFKIEGCNETSITDNSSTSNVYDNEFMCSVLNQDTASLIASLFGLMNLFARAVGGTFSDGLYKHFKLPGRLLAHSFCLACEGVMLIILSQVETIPVAIFVLIVTSICVQASEGTTYAIVPYVNSKRTGLIAGFVGAGGNTGAIIWNTIWGQLTNQDPSLWFLMVGSVVICGSLLTLLIRIDGNTIWKFKDKSKIKAVQ